MKKRILALFLVALTVMFLGCSCGSDRIRIGTAGAGGIYNEFGTALAQLALEDENLNIEVKTTAGSAANVRLLSQNYLELAIAQADVVNDGYYNTSDTTFSDSKKYQGYSAVAALYSEACQIVVKEDSNIWTVDDLLGKTVSIGESESGTQQNAIQILSAYGLSSNMLTQVNLEYSTAAKQLVSGKIDALFCTAGVNTTVIQELSKQCGIRLLNIGDEECAKLKAAYSFYTDYTIPANTYTGQTDKVNTLCVKSVLLANDTLSADTVKKITQVIFKNSDKLQFIVSSDLQLDEKTATSGVTIPFHKGAAEYYSSKNITVSTQ